MRTLPLLALIALAACAPQANLTLTPRQQPVISRTDYVMDLAAGRTGLAPGERARLAGWLDGLKLGYGDSLAVDDPAGMGAARDVVASVAGERGMLLSPAAPVTAGVVPPGAVRVVLTRSAARIEGCPDFHYEDLPQQSAATSRNFGCAVNGNMAAMLADPQDLVRGHASGGPGDARTSVKAVGAWRDRAPTGSGGLKSDSAGGK